MTITAGTKRSSEIDGERLEKDESKRSKNSVSKAANPGDHDDTGKPKILNEYQGYSLQQEKSTAPLKIDVVQTSSMSAATFFENYVSQRKPCILDGLPTTTVNGSTKSMTITRDLLETLAGDKVIQIEKRFSASENFGQNRTSTRQAQFTIRDFFKALLDDSKDSNGNGELLYWSTQEDTDDPFNVPCRQLVNQNHIPAHLSLAGNLVLSSCNLWMGASEEGASSGLHHDYHDNFYLLLEGRKRFRLLSPDCAPHLHVYGEIERIYPNGRVSYVGNEARADGVPMASLEEEELEDEDDEEEEEIVLGKGFDYVSDGDDDDDDDENAVFDENNQTDDFDEIMGSEADDKDDDDNQQPEESSETSDKQQNKNEEDEHPDSFSRINPCRTDEATLHQEFPSFASCRQVMAEIKAGQMLYLPAGWFHEVTSYSDSDNSTAKSKSATTASSTGFEGQCHMALNYWFHPPDALDNFESPYQDDFWRKEEQHRLKAQRAKQD